MQGFVNTSSGRFILVFSNDGHKKAALEVAERRNCAVPLLVCTNMNINLLCTKTDF